MSVFSIVVHNVIVFLLGVKFGIAVSYLIWDYTKRERKN